MEKYSEYIKEIRNGNENYFNVILEDHRRIIYKIINNYTLEKGDYMLDTESLFQEGSLELYKAIFTYEENRGMSFTSYAYMVIRSKITTLVRNELKRFEDEHYSIDNYPNVDYHISLANMSISDNPVAYHKELEFERKLDSFLDKLNPEDRKIIEMRNDRVSYKEISERLHINTKRVDNRLRVLRNKLHEYLNEEE